MTKFAVFAALKGGVGKTTLANTVANAAAQKGLNVLLVDLDHQGSLTMLYTDEIDHKFTSDMLLKGYGVDFDTEVIQSENNPNVKLIPAHLFEDDEKLQLEDDDMLKFWRENQEGLDKFDLVIFDTHPDFGRSTRNALIASDAIISPVLPGIFEWKAHEHMEAQLANYGIETKIGFVGNNLQKNEGVSHELRGMLAEEDTTIAVVDHRSAINNATAAFKSIYDIIVPAKVKLEVDTQVDKILAFIMK